MVNPDPTGDQTPSPKPTTVMPIARTGGLPTFAAPAYSSLEDPINHVYLGVPSTGITGTFPILFLAQAPYAPAAHPSIIHGRAVVIVEVL